MLEQKADKRPAVSDLLSHEQVQVRILEKKYKDKYAYLKKKEQEIVKREKAVAAEGHTKVEQEEDDSEEMKELDRVEQRLLAEIERTERENQEID